MLTKIRQIALASNDLDESEAFFSNILGAEKIARFDPPGLLFYNFDGVRLLFEKGASTGLVYFHVEDIEKAHESLSAAGVVFDQPPTMIHADADGTFGAAGEEEWMAFFKDPAGNTLALAARRAPRSA